MSFEIISLEPFCTYLSCYQAMRALSKCHDTAAVGFGATTAGFGLSGTGPVFLRFLFLWVFSSSFTFLSPVREEEMGLYCCVL